jgi:hypothetical protein
MSLESGVVVELLRTLALEVASPTSTACGIAAAGIKASAS